jgi:hypothetical protein
VVNGAVWGGVNSSEGGGVDAGVVLCCVCLSLWSSSPKESLMAICCGLFEFVECCAFSISIDLL